MNDLQVEAIRDLLAQAEEGPKACIGIDSGGTMDWKGSFHNHLENLREIVSGVQLALTWKPGKIDGDILNLGQLVVGEVFPVDLEETTVWYARGRGILSHTSNHDTREEAQRALMQGAMTFFGREVT